MEVQLATGEWVKTPSGKQLMKPHQTTYVDVFGNEQVSRRAEEQEKYQQKSVTGFKDEAEMLAQTTVVRPPLPPSPQFQSCLPEYCTDAYIRPNASTQ